MRKKKKESEPTSDGTKQMSGLKQTIEQLLLNREEDRMIDDHGPVILGRRDRKPRLPEDE